MILDNLWENFIVSEKRKMNVNHRIFANAYFWRNYQKKEIDYIEELNGRFELFVCKYSPNKKVEMPKDFANNYSNFDFNVLHSDNFWKYIIKTQ